jgi:hypothetical protein
VVSSLRDAVGLRPPDVNDLEFDLLAFLERPET